MAEAGAGASPDAGVGEPLAIERVGGRGDGVAADGTLVAGALPGERVRVVREADGRRARLLAVEGASPERVAPFCPHFGTCGGCALQHWAGAPYAIWKRARVVEALARAGLAAEAEAVEPLVDAHGAGRRRATFHVRRLEGEGGGRAAAGFMAARSHALVPIEACPITEPGLAGAPALAARLAGPLGGGTKPLDVVATATPEGLDLDLRGHGPVSTGARAALVALATGPLAGLVARVSLHGEVLAENRPPRLAVGPARPVPPPGGFLQATRMGEERIGALVLEAVEAAPGRGRGGGRGGGRGARRVADLFAGIGPLALRLAAGRAVHAVDAEAAPLAALERAARATPGLHPVATERRDLFRRPLLEAELDAFEAVVLDPPRAGAGAQCARLAASRVPLVAMVSCDPASFARDAAALVAGGYALERTVPVDQFKWSVHVEVVGVFRRAAERRTAPRPARLAGGARRGSA